MDPFPNPSIEETIFTEEWSKTEQRSDHLTQSTSMGSQVDLPRLDQMMAPSAPVPPLTPVSGDRDLTLSAQGKQPQSKTSYAVPVNTVRKSFLVVGIDFGITFEGKCPATSVDGV